MKEKGGREREKERLDRLMNRKQVLIKFSVVFSTLSLCTGFT